MTHYTDCSVIPIVNDRMCNTCGTCLEVCYGFKVNPEFNLTVFTNLSNYISGNYMEAYIGFATDETLRFNSTSGGAVSTLLIHALEEGLIDGAIVTRMQAGNLPHAKAFIAHTSEEIISAVGSKYCPVSFAECLEAAEEQKSYALVGLPCHIYGVRKLAEVNPKVNKAICLYIGILCGGLPSYLGTQYLLKTYGAEKQRIMRLEYRGGGWPGRLLIQSESQGQRRETSIPYPKYWRGAFRLFQLYRCRVCYDGFNEFSDISCGDAWAQHLIRRDERGFSLVIVRTEEGKKLTQAASEKKRIKLFPISKEEIIRLQQGIVEYKHRTLRARIDWARLARRNLPRFDLGKIPPARLATYLTAANLCIGNMMASRRKLWWLFERYLSLRKIMNTQESLRNEA